MRILLINRKIIKKQVSNIFLQYSEIIIDFLVESLKIEVRNVIINCLFFLFVKAKILF